MKILVLCENLYPPIGGAERALLSIIEFLRRKGHDLEVHCIGDGFDYHPEVGVWTHEIKGSKRHSTPSTTRKEKPSEYYMRNWISLRSKAKQFYKISKMVIGKFQPDLIIAQNDFSAEVIDAAGKIKTVHFVQDTSVLCPVNFVLTSYEDCKGKCLFCLPRKAQLQYLWVRSHMEAKQRAVKNASLVICNSVDTSKKIEYGLGRKTHVVYPILDGCDVKPAKTHEYILFLGRGPYKGFYDMMKIAEMLPQYKFVVCGVETKTEVEIMKSQKNIESWGVVTPNKAFSGARICIMPTEAESFGRPIVEAAFAGVPVVAHGIGGVPDVLGNAGFLVEKGNFTEWKDRIRILMEDEIIWNEMSQLAFKNSERFTTEKIEMTLIKTFRNEGIEIFPCI